MEVKPPPKLSHHQTLMKCVQSFGVALACVFILQRVNSDTVHVFIRLLIWLVLIVAVLDIGLKVRYLRTGKGHQFDAMHEFSTPRTWPRFYTPFANWGAKAWRVFFIIFIMGALSPLVCNESMRAIWIFPALLSLFGVYGYLGLLEMEKVSDKSNWEPK